MRARLIQHDKREGQGNSAFVFKVQDCTAVVYGKYGREFPVHHTRTAHCFVLLENVEIVAHVGDADFTGY